MVDNACVPDFSEFFGKQELSDVNVFLDEDNAAACTGSSAAGKKRKRSKKAPGPNEDEGIVQQPPLPGHSMVLVAFSKFFKAKLMGWSAGPSSKPEIRLSVPAGQLELGKLLLRAMYQSQPDLGTISQEQLLQLLILADRYSVNKVMHAIAAALQAVPQAELQWETVLGLYTLPPGCTDACKPLMPAAQQQLQQQLGDLEVALSDSTKRQRLLALPHKVLLALLQDEETKVAAENTVFRVIESWHDYQQQHCGGSSKQELVQLLEQIRMQHCTQPFVATVLVESPLAAECFSALDLGLACICSSTPGSEPGLMSTALEEAECPALARFPSWKQPKRPASAVTKISMEQEVSLADLKQKVEAAQQGGNDTLYTLLESQRWQGEVFEVSLKVGVEGETGEGAAAASQATGAETASSSRPFSVGIFVGPQLWRKDMLRLISFSVTASAAQPVPHRRGGFVPRHKTQRMTRQGFGFELWGWPDFFSYGTVDSWAAFEAKLRADNLVHAGDCLHIKVEITEVL